MNTMIGLEDAEEENGAVDGRMGRRWTAYKRHCLNHNAQWTDWLLKDKRDVQTLSGLDFVL